MSASPPQLPVPRRYELPFLSRQVETPTTMTFRFSTEGTGFRYLSNQAVRLALPAVSDPWGPVRAFSLSSSPTESGFIAITCKMTGSPFKEGLRAMGPDDRAVVTGPLGDLLYDPTRPAVLLAGGIGITPFRGMARYAKDTRSTEPMVLLYSARVPEEFVFRSELDALAAAHPPFRVHYTVTRPSESATRWEGRTGRIDAPWISEQLGGLTRPKVYVVGLPGMVEELLDLLRGRMGIAEDDLEYEYFRGY